MIIRPQKAKINYQFDSWITTNSPTWQKKSLVQIRRYQAIECNDGFFMDESDQCWKQIEIYPFIDEFYDEKRNIMREWLIGGACFYKEDDDTVDLHFCWIHPFYRNKGLLKKAWPIFKKRFGHFSISEPISKSFQGFLYSIGHSEV